MKYLLEELIGKPVKVWSQRGDHEYSDEGVLEAFDGLCLRVRLSSHEVLYFPIHNVRLVKPQ